jgi:hypothetical protein
VTRAPTRAALAAAAALLAAACSEPGSTARSTAEAFLDAHYVRIDLDATRELVSGLAREKVEHEISLTRDQPIDGETLQPRVNYKLHRADEAAEAAQYAYELTIRPPGIDPFTKLVMVTVRNDADRWAVTNYSESDMPSR